MPSRIRQAAILVGEVSTGRADTPPHPLTDIADRSLVDHLLDRLWTSGIADVLVVPDGPEGASADLVAHLARRGDARVRVAEHAHNPETPAPLAEVMGGWAEGPLVVLSSQALWLDGPTSAIDRMAAEWRPDAMDALVLGVAVTKAFGGTGLGDLTLDPLGRVTALTGGELAPYYNTGVHIIESAALGDAHSLRDVLRAALDRGRLYGLVHDGVWFHVGTERDLTLTRAMLAEPEVRWVIS